MDHISLTPASGWYAAGFDREHLKPANLSDSLVLDIEPLVGWAGLAINTGGGTAFQVDPVILTEDRKRAAIRGDDDPSMFMTHAWVLADDLGDGFEERVLHDLTALGDVRLPEGRYKVDCLLRGRPYSRLVIVSAGPSVTVDSRSTGETPR